MLHSEALYEDETFPERQLASLVLAKVYYHLQEYDESMAFALGAGNLFKLDNEGEFEETIISKCVDTYINVSASRHAIPRKSVVSSDALPTLATSFANGSNEANATAATLTSPTTPFSQSALPSKSLLSRENTLSEEPVNKGKSKLSSPVLDKSKQDALQGVIERLFETCLREGRYRQVIGIAVEAKNLDVLRRVIKRASEDEKKASTTGATDELMEYILDICMGVVQERGLRTEILRLILDLLNDIPDPDYFSIAKCVVYLNQDEEASTMLKKLVSNDNQNSTAIAYQIAFDLYDNGTQEFLAKVIKDLPKKVEEVATEADKEDRKFLSSQVFLVFGTREFNLLSITR